LVQEFELKKYHLILVSLKNVISSHPWWSQTLWLMVFFFYTVCSFGSTKHFWFIVAMDNIICHCQKHLKVVVIIPSLCLPIMNPLPFLFDGGMAIPQYDRYLVQFLTMVHVGDSNRFLHGMNCADKTQLPPMSSQSQHQHLQEFGSCRKPRACSQTD
jgi:hypothetical protein